MTLPACDPFLKWPGGKRRLLPRIQEVLPPGSRLVEPFAGGAAVSLGLDYPRYLLADANQALIGLFKRLKADGEDFIAYCRSFFGADHNLADVYYANRSLYNTTADARLKAALFIYLNRHTYNGLYRENSQGEFNSPFGRYVRPYFPEAEMRAFSARAKHMSLRAQDYRKTFAGLQPGDVVYCDPPYVPLSKTAKFTDYAAGGFTPEDQASLADEARRAAKAGIPVVISNHDTPAIRDLYRGAKIVSFAVQRTISQDIYNRQKAGELLAVFT